MISLLIYLPTIAYIPHIIYLFAFLYMVVFKKYSFKINENVKLILFLIILTITNQLFHIDINTLSINNIIPFSILILVTYYISVNISKKDLLYIVYFIFCESLIVLVEFKLGITTFFYGLDRFKEISDVSDTILYFFRPMGLSENSSIVSGKIFIAILLIFYLKVNINKYIFFIFFIIFNFALIITFNRTALITVYIFYILLVIKFYMKNIQNYREFIIKILIFCIVLTSILFFLNNYLDLIIEQFNKGSSQSDILTGRGAIWRTFLEFIQDNFILGNGSYKLYLPFYHGGWTIAHAHNSFLEVIATHGIIISLLYFYFIGRNIRISNLIYIIPFLVFSITQYYLFWGISIQDIVFLYFLIKVRKNVSR